MSQVPGELCYRRVQLTDHLFCGTQIISESWSGDALLTSCSLYSFLIHNITFYGFIFLQSAVVQIYYTEYYRYKQFIGFKLGTLLSRMMKP